ncbi:cell division protein ZapE [Achromobacter denitrificans]|uniref:cell division protein ZapE n=1 Tax=Achromobacter denitrificans TaxID=32002 RepID=UPI00242D3864|nr:cell division protein ZapE [Achromobacter denitrificans]MBV2159723.1 AFG1 family ATPase [Achromobacter denitrificans]
MIDAYEALLKTRGYQSDPAQRAAAQRLQGLYTELVGFKAARQGSRIKQFLNKPKMPRSVYFWGGVGRGKSFLMDCFYDSVPYRRKRRVHFHAFMQEVQNDLRKFNNAPDPLQKVADRISEHTRLLCFDEFHVSDIADAMILGRLLDALFDRGVIFVMTSNYPPDGLYPNGLMRINFLPTIEKIKQRFDVIEVDHGTDYRLRTLEKMEIYLVPHDDAAERKMAEDFRRLAASEGRGGSVEILGRNIDVVRQAPGVIWFDFASLCGGPRSQNDYLEIAREHHTVILSNVPKMLVGNASEARRFTWLIDVLYDHRVKLIMSAECEPEEIYTEGALANEFHRTVSRILEMQSREYLESERRLTVSL